MSGSMHGEKFWKQEQNNVGMKMMKVRKKMICLWRYRWVCSCAAFDAVTVLVQDMGWDQGSGLGQNNDGQAEAIRVNKKADRVGECLRCFFSWLPCRQYPL